MKNDPSGFQDIAAMRNCQRQMRALLDQQNGQALLAVDFNDLLENRLY